MKLSKSDKDLHKNDQKVEQPAETTKQQDVAPAVEKTSPHKEISPVPDAQSQPQPEKPEEIQEEKVEVAKDVSIDERDTSTRDAKKIDSADLPELETDCFALCQKVKHPTS